MKLSKLSEFEKMNLELNTERANKDALMKKVRACENRINFLQKRISTFKEEKKIVITNHCYDRFRERFMKLDTKKIDSLLLDKVLTDKIRRIGNGNYVVPKLPLCAVVVVDMRMVTCIKIDDIDFRLSRLKDYIGYYVNRLEDRANGYNVPINTFSSFLKADTLIR